MSCKELEKFDRGKIDEAEFLKHAGDCPVCQEALRLDTEIFSLSKSLKQLVEAPFLWNRIEESLCQAPREVPIRKVWWRSWRFASAVVVLAAVVCLGIYFAHPKDIPSSGLLTQKALTRVEQKEQEYMQAIRNLEKLVLPQMAGLDLELNFLYRSRLETIDAQIKQCREALVFNSGNAHIRRHLMMALIDKKQTLVDVINLMN
ncbi:MAG: hypothetical protein JXB26_12350 [Candidatus Aminicenantes bacterium]|nr:hypothetical protein [Candidatus Aminicenantes bacterium]